jgi:hypothetical protein
MPADFKKTPVASPAEIEDVVWLQAPFSERPDGLDAAVDQGLVECKERLRRELIERSSGFPTAIKGDSGEGGDERDDSA